MKKILVASDLSERSKRGLARAGLLAREHGAALIVASMVDDELPLDIAERRVAETRDALEKRVAEVLGGAPVTLVVKQGDPVVDLHDLARAEAVDLIVIGAHKPRAWRDIFFSTTAEALIRASEKPVLMVSSEASARYATVLAGVDLSPSCAAAIETARAVAPAAALKSFYAFTTPFQGFAGGAAHMETAPFLKEAEAALDAWLASEAAPAGLERPRVVEGGVATALLQRAAEENPDLVAIGAHGRSSFNPSLLGGFTEQLLRRPPSDLLVVRR